MRKNRWRSRRSAAARRRLRSFAPTAIGSAGRSSRPDPAPASRMKTRHNAFLHVLGTAAILSGGVLLGAGGQQPAIAQPPPPARGPVSRVNPRLAPRGADVGGFLQRWVILEPMRVAPQLTDSAIQAVVKTESLPNQFTVVPHDGD